MAVTKLMHMKESPGWPHTHLKNSIDYVLDVAHDCEKTDYGKLVGGNCGTDAAQILAAMLDTKEVFGKPRGRQGYHFVISFPPGEASPEKAMEAARLFCEQYLGDRYEYVYAVHKDKAHSHAHIVFNSVSREDGYKYHYKKGDWEKYVQPVTDAVCKSLGLPPLEFEPGAKAPGESSYARWAESKGMRVTWESIMRADIDLAVQRSSNMVEFYHEMEQMGYDIREGNSYKHGTKFFKYRFTDIDGKTHSHRSAANPGYRGRNMLPPDYGPEGIARKIKTKDGSRHYEELSGMLRRATRPVLENYACYSWTRTYKRIQSVSWCYSRANHGINPYVVRASRSDIARIDKLFEQIRFLEEEQITDSESLNEAARRTDAEISRLISEERMLRDMLGLVDNEERGRIDRAAQMVRDIAMAESSGDTHLADEIKEDLADYLEDLPDENLAYAPSRMDEIGLLLKDARRRRRMLRDIAAEPTEGGVTDTPKPNQRARNPK